MFNVIIQDKNGGKQVLEVEKDDITIGRSEENDIVLPKGNVSKKHTRIVFREGKFVVLDLKSTNGTFINGQKVSAPTVVHSGEKVQVGDFTIQVQVDGKEAMAARGGASQGSASTGSFTAPAPKQVQADAGTTRSSAPAAAEVRKERKGPRDRPRRDPMIEQYSALLKKVHDRIIEAMDLRRLNINKLADEELWKRTEEKARAIVQAMDAGGEIPVHVDRQDLVRDIMNEALGLGPLEEFLADEDITEIMVNNADQIYIEKKGKITLSNKTFSSDRAVIGVIERIVAPLGRRIDESSPMVDARLKDGSRVNAIIPPLAIRGPSITIRKFRKTPLQVDDLVGFGTLTKGMAEFLRMCVRGRKNIIISGGTGSGKTTLLNVLSGYIPEDERIVTVEDAAELQLHQDHIVSLETRPPNIEGKGEITIRDLVRNSLRMRPDRIVVGECRGGESLDMLQAMNTGHDGSLTTVHANTPRDALARLETMVLMAGMELPVKAIREQIQAAIQIIVQQNRFSDGSRKVTKITEITGMEVDIITMQDIFYFKQEGFDEKNRVRGKYVATGFIPKFYDDLQRRGIPVDMSIFRES